MIREELRNGKQDRYGNFERHSGIEYSTSTSGTATCLTLLTMIEVGVDMPTSPSKNEGSKNLKETSGSKKEKERKKNLGEC